jgi:Concanavalin A-like lectin/glucanases superfamily
MTMRAVLLLMFVVTLWVAPAWSQDITTGMTLWYRFDETSGTTPQDSSGNGRHANAASTVTWLSGSACKVAGCLGFGATRTTAVSPQTAVFLSTTLMTAAAGTMAAWVNPHGAPPNHPSAISGLPVVIGDNAQWSGIHRGTIAGANDGFRFYNWDINSDILLVTYTVDTWVHLAWVHGGGNLIAYKDGVQFATMASGNTGGAANVQIGFISSITLDAEIDEIRTYTRALSAADITALYQFGLATLGNRWRMMQRERWDKALARWLFAGRLR